MKVIPISDLHGFLPVITTKCDVVTISGDFSPLYCQRNYFNCIQWFEHEFVKWCMNDLNCEKVIFIAGNHDFMCQNPNFKNDLENILSSVEGAKDKIIYLQNSSYEYNGKVFFGCPYSDIPGWAFSIASEPWGYCDIEYDVDVLLVHQAPDFENVGTSNIGSHNERNFGSEELLDEIEEKKPKFVFCGHIHSGNHNVVNFGDTKMYNVSIMDEDYEPNYFNLVTKQVINV